ncbi:hypothetical protein N5I59_01415, partial [Klebsiella pneumoniae]|uniref:hypothetical protein n=1 Tax=Klebsiella pneumoniae TaxID=573 RepID=UPI002246A0A5
FIQQSPWQAKHRFSGDNHRGYPSLFHFPVSASLYFFPLACSYNKNVMQFIIKRSPRCARFWSSFGGNTSRSTVTPELTLSVVNS